jgi:UDP-N-acetylmuramyl pentapeptide phosphotransferase/UDP-N-acetylglucosamine-1-phosphate transferase
MLSVVAIIQNNEFTGWYLFIIPIIEIFIIIAVFVSKKKKRQGDGSPVSSVLQK